MFAELFWLAWLLLLSRHAEDMQMQIILLIISKCIHTHNTYILSYFNFGLIKMECDPQNIFKIILLRMF